MYLLVNECYDGVPYIITFQTLRRFRKNRLTGESRSQNEHIGQCTIWYSILIKSGTK